MAVFRDAYLTKCRDDVRNEYGRTNDLDELRTMTPRFNELISMVVSRVLNPDDQKYIYFVSPRPSGRDLKRPLIIDVSNVHFDA